MANDPSSEYPEISGAINAVPGCLHIQTRNGDIITRGYGGLETEFAGWSPTLHDIRIHIDTNQAFNDSRYSHLPAKEDLDDTGLRHLERLKQMLEIQQRRSDFAASIGLHQPIMLIEKDDPFFNHIIVDRSYAEYLVDTESDPASHLHAKLISLYENDTSYSGYGEISKDRYRIREHEAGLVEYIVQHKIAPEITAVGHHLLIDSQIGDTIPDTVIAAARGRRLADLIDLPAPYADRTIFRVHRIIGMRFAIELERDRVTFGDLKG